MNDSQIDESEYTWADERRGDGRNTIQWRKTHKRNTSTNKLLNKAMHRR